MPPSDSQPPVLVIVGRPNVGKSTLFNRITRSRRAIVGDEPGITRDRIGLEARFQDKRFLVTDTGGMTFGEEGRFPELINEGVRTAVDQAAHVIFVVDGRALLTATDRDLADFLRRSGKPVTVAVNKCDIETLDVQSASFYELGFDEPMPVSAEHNQGMADLLERATQDFPVAEEEEEEALRRIRTAIIGRPNVGKSTLLNRLIGEERSIVSPIAGTTRDAVDATIVRGNVELELVDTAGIRRKGKTKEMAEKLSVVMAQRHLRMADVALMTLDASEGVNALDATIAGYAHEIGRALVLVVNKWDLASEQKKAEFREQVRDELKFVGYAPIVFISALLGDKVESLFPLILKVFRESRKRVPTGELNRFLADIDMDRATTKGFRKPKIHYVTQARVGPPTFVFFTNREEKLHFSFERFLINRIRDKFVFEGSPIVVKTKAKRR